MAVVLDSKGRRNQEQVVLVYAGEHEDYIALHVEGIGERDIDQESEHMLSVLVLLGLVVSID